MTSLGAGRLLLLASLACACAGPAAGPSRASDPAPEAPPAQQRPQPAPPTVAAPELVAEPGTEKGARAFVTNFLQARMARDERLARTYLSAISSDQYGSGENGLSLGGAAGSRLAGWDFVSVEAADASSFEVRVKIREQPAGSAEEASYTETLFVGPGPDLEGRPRPWIVRGAMRGGSSR